MPTPEHHPPPASDSADRSNGRGHDEPGRDDAYERAQPDSQPTVSSEPEPEDDPANAG
jgi:hypothetical protein